MGLVSKKTTLHVHHFFFFFYISLPLFCTTRKTDTTWNFLKLPSYTLYGGNVVRVLFTFFPLPLIFALVAAGISHFLNTATKFSCCYSYKKCLLCFLSFALALCRSFSHWLFFFSLACRLLSVFLCFYLYLFSKFVRYMTTNLSLIL